MLESLTQSTPSQPIELTVILDDFQHPISIEQIPTKERVFTWSFAIEEAMFNELLH
jgi:hypothetical protein